MMTEHGTPILRVVTRPLATHPDLLAHADPQHPLVWQRGDRGAVGIGETLRLEFSGPSRFADASAAWRAIAARADIEDPVRLPGTGLIAFGSFAFDRRSGARSVLIVPRILLARHRGVSWITEITEMTDASEVAETAPSATIPDARPLAVWEPIELSSPEELPAPHSRSSIAAYRSGVAEAGRRIAEGALEKIVLAREIEGRIPADADLRVPLARLSDEYLDCWTYAIDGFIGASPETLVRSTGGAVSARVLAGTRGRHTADPARDRYARDELLTSDKEQHEHAFAVQSVVTALAPHVTQLQASEEPFPLQLPNVWHLATDLGAKLAQEATAIELVAALHPTAAVAGTPTEAAIEAIHELEPFDRERYSGAVGWIDAAGDGEWVIGLRCAQIGAPGAAGAAPDERTVVASAGGGIVAGSDPEYELRETVSKFRPITDAFGAVTKRTDALGATPKRTDAFG